MKPGRGVLVIAVCLISAVTILTCLLRNAEAGQRGSTVVQSPRGNVALQGPRGNVAVGTRYNVLPDSVKIVILNDRAYYVDGASVYYLPCDDENTVFCVVPAPQ